MRPLLHRAAMDVQYAENAAYGAAVVFAEWTDATAAEVLTCRYDGALPYVSGAFYQRELPVLLRLLELVQRRFDVGAVVVDGHVDLGAKGPGLGRHLFHAVDERITVIGVAKNAFPDNGAQPVTRGQSSKPLWVSSTADLDAAMRSVHGMHGAFRIPTLLKLADSHARRAASASTAVA